MSQTISSHRLEIPDDNVREFNEAQLTTFDRAMFKDGWHLQIGVNEPRHIGTKA